MNETTLNTKGETMTAATAIKEMMTVWATIEAAAKKQFPKASKDELYAICKSAMNHQLGL
jgi:hypothetical protein